MSPQLCCPSSIYLTAVIQTQQTPLIEWMRPTRALNWCNDGEREQFPFLHIMVAVLGGSPVERQFIMCPSSWPCHCRNRQAHVCMNYKPSHLPSPSSLPPSRTVEVWHRGERENMGLLQYARVLKCIFICPSRPKSAEVCTELCRTKSKPA